MCLTILSLSLLCIAVYATCLFIKRSGIQNYMASIPKTSTTVGFFHPYCNAGGGGERVLWTAIRTLQRKYPKIHCVVYTGDKGVTKSEILKTVQERFNISLENNIHFVFLKSRFFVEARLYPVFTLLFQSLGSIVVGLEALFRFVPDIYFDSMGYAFTYPIFRYLGNCCVGCYVHYPTISTDMLDAVSSGREVVNNKRFISRNKYLSSIKLVYYKIFAWMYGYVGKRADIVMVNSTWTKNHILSLWKNHSHIQLIYPPCDVAKFRELPLPDSKKNLNMLSIAQFRPEKNHRLQIEAFHNYLTNSGSRNSNLILAGGCRSKEDEDRVHGLKMLCKKLNVHDNITFKINISFKGLLTEIQNAGIALHSMWNEHFGISVVECMAAGQIIIAHNSGGPKLDIVITEGEKQNGFLADDVESYANAMKYIFNMSEDQQQRIRENARKSAERFSEENFEKSFDSAFSKLYELCV